MQVNNKMIFVLLFFSLSATAAQKVPQKKAKHPQRNISSIDCSFIKWPYEDKVITKENKLALLKLDRNQVRSFYLNEITTSPVNKELAFGLYDFLISTEPSENVRNFLEITSYGSDLKSTTPNALNQKEICDLAKHVSIELPKN